MTGPRRPLSILLVSPYHGGSHESWADGLRRNSGHEIETLTLPDRFWKWRMHGGAATLARRFMESASNPDVLVATDMLDLTTFLALTRRRTAGVPVLLYMHENQLTYPLPEDGDTGPMRRQLGERDRHYAFINFASMLAADRVAFNSAYHRDAWFDELPRFLRHFPEHNESGSVAALRDKSTVLPVGVVCPHPSPGAKADVSHDAPPLIVWNQRWEYDKNPDQMLEALARVADRGIAFRLALCGQSFGTSPASLQAAPERFGDRLVHFGFAPTERYHRLLDEALLTLSTADHEFFGIAVLEAMSRRTLALLPDRLSYPELLSGPDVTESTRRTCLYGSFAELVARACEALQDPAGTGSRAEELARNARRFDWTEVARHYDDAFTALAAHS